MLHPGVERLPGCTEPQAENKRLQARRRRTRHRGTRSRADPQMLRVCRTIEKVANTNASVMLLGESGTARRRWPGGLHQHSTAAMAEASWPSTGAAIPENLLESELFGYEKAPSPVP